MYFIDTFYQYNHSRNTIVEEFIEYVERNRESDLIADLMANRQRTRKNQLKPYDKNINPLIAIPGSPGSGKSTFLAHLPGSTAMMNYYGERSLPIVVPVTFNSMMGNFYKNPTTNAIEDTFGLRVIYAAAASMGLVGNTKYQLWRTFVEEYSEFANISLEDALRILNKLFGENRPILLLVDELSKAVNDQSVMREIGEQLNENGNFDAIVSSLSPTYVEEAKDQSRISQCFHF
jgi:hypothetical protein